MTKVWEETRIFQRIKGAKHGIILLVGSGQWGKTVAANVLAGLPPWCDRDVALVNYPADFVREYYPNRYRAVTWPADIARVPRVLHPSRDFVIIDDAAWLVSARDHATAAARDIQKFLTIASHNELFIVVTIQNTSLLDISMLQSQDVYLFHKHMDAKSMEFERPESITDQMIANKTISRAWAEHPEVHPKSWTWCSTTGELLQLRMPEWWRPQLSKPFYGRIPEQDRHRKKEREEDDERRF